MAANNLTQSVIQTLTKIFERRVELDFARAGFDYIADTNTHTGDWTAITVVGTANAVLNSVTTVVGDDLTTVTLVPGTTVYGTFNSIDLTSGVVIAYRNTI